MTPKKGYETRPKVSDVTLPTEAVMQAEFDCQWFLDKRNFCGKIKKSVNCEGNVKNCPFCK